MYGKIDTAILKELTAIVGAGNVITDREKMLDYTHDEFALEEARRFPEAVVKPGDTRAVAAVMKLCARKKIPVTPRGGGTGLCGGCVPFAGGIVLSLERMNQVREVDADNQMAVVEAGVRLADFYRAIEEKGLFFPPHPGDESATVGGIIATNAGGARAVKHGVVRNFVKGVEVVLADGAIETIGGKFVKNSSGYSLLHLFIGSEGTLGIITSATMNLMVPPAATSTLIAAYPDLNSAVRTVPAIMRGGLSPLAVEFLELEPILIAGEMLDRKWPCRQGKAQLMIILDGSGEDEVLGLAEAAGKICLENGALDVFVADGRQKQRDVLEIRSHLYEALKKYMVEDIDVSIPRAAIADFVGEVYRIGEEEGLWVPTYGHAADGNVHVHLMRARRENRCWRETGGWEGKYRLVREKVLALGKKYQGMLSGEHGIGMVKTGFLEDFVGSRQLEMMKAVKKAFDPDGILNPGKIFSEKT